jgi:hypothetical protein
MRTFDFSRRNIDHLAGVGILRKNSIAKEVTHRSGMNHDIEELFKQKRFQKIFEIVKGLEASEAKGGIFGNWLRMGSEQGHLMLSLSGCPCDIEACFPSEDIRHTAHGI